MRVTFTREKTILRKQELLYHKNCSLRIRIIRRKTQTKPFLVGLVEAQREVSVCINICIFLSIERERELVLNGDVCKWMQTRRKCIQKTSLSVFPTTKGTTTFYGI
jgi:hypothetical protein